MIEREAGREKKTHRERGCVREGVEQQSFDRWYLLRGLNPKTPKLNPKTQTLNPARRASPGDDVIVGVTCLYLLRGLNPNP